MPCAKLAGVLGLPDGITACLFDLDGVLTQTTKAHAKAWKRGTRKNNLVLELIKDEGVDAYPDAVAFVKYVRDRGLRRAVVSSSANAQEVLIAAGVADLFEARIDGVVAENELVVRELTELSERS